MKPAFNSNILSYFKDPKTYDELCLVDNGSVKLHWANWNILLNHMHNSIDKGNDYSSLSEIKHILLEYKERPLWIKNKQGAIKSNLYELYSYYLDPRLRELWFELNDETLVSFKTGAGPFVRLQSMRWFDYDIYKLFVYQKLLANDGIACRNFRISVDIPLRCEFPESVIDPVQISISQISKQGILLKLNGAGDLRSFKISEKVNFYGDFTTFLNSRGEQISETIDIFNKSIFNKNESFIHNFSVNKNVFEIATNEQNSAYSNGQEYYIFLAYEDIIESESKSIKASLSEAVEKFEDYSISHLKKVA